MPLKLVIVDDHKIIRDGLRVLIQRESDLEVVGEAADGRAGVAETLRLRPGVVLLDMAMPELNGIEAARQLRAKGFAGGIVMLSMHSERRTVIQARTAGVDAYVLKEYAFEQVRAAIDAAARRETWFSPQLSDPLSGDEELPSIDRLLTPREREVLQMLAEGRGAKEIAFRLGISPRTVEVHRANMMGKLKVDNVVDLTRIAVREGLATL
ncbi:MAG: hypothetical protein B9S34_11570 [Opitutia bacterium Tous-C1TDCM]|nr:MAG: hypothetical protein B9S34_11570 [Opitutae bacterium Tous-C1TDCM]